MKGRGGQSARAMAETKITKNAIAMTRGIVGVLAISLLPMRLCGASYYTERPDDSNVVELNSRQFPGLHADGLADDTAILQRAIDQASGAGKVLLIPPGRYLISKTIGVPPETRLIGFGGQRPVFVLGAHTPGYGANAPQYVIWFTGGGGGRRRRAGSGGLSDANPGTFYSGLLNVDFEIQDGNPAAVAIRGHFAQHGVIAHVDFNVGSGFAGMDAGGNEAEDLLFHGGGFGIITAGTSPSWQYTLLDSSFDGQRKAAFETRNTGLTPTRDSFENLPTAIAIDENQPERLWMKNCLLQNISGPAIIIGEE